MFHNNNQHLMLNTAPMGTQVTLNILIVDLDILQN